MRRALVLTCEEKPIQASSTSRPSPSLPRGKNGARRQTHQQTLSSNGVAEAPATETPDAPAPLEPQWLQQWELFRDFPSVRWLFDAWIHPNTMEVFRDATVLDAGCGAGLLMTLIRPHARRLVGIDLSADTVARDRFADDPAVEVHRADILTYDAPERFDVAVCVGVLHHTLDPDRAFANLSRLVKPGGRVIVWVYSAEGNAILKWMVEPVRKCIFRHFSRKTLWSLSKLIAASMYPVVHTLYRIPLTFLPYHAYFRNFRKLSLTRNTCNVFDKLNAPRTTLISGPRIEAWFDFDLLEDVHISSYQGVSWRGSGTIKPRPNDP